MYQGIKQQLCEGMRQCGAEVPPAARTALSAASCTDHAPNGILVSKTSKHLVISYQVRTSSRELHKKSLRPRKYEARKIEKVRTEYEFGC